MPAEITAIAARPAIRQARSGGELPMSGVFWTVLMLGGAMFAIVSAINYIVSLV